MALQPPTQKQLDDAKRIVELIAQADAIAVQDPVLYGLHLATAAALRATAYGLKKLEERAVQGKA